METSENRGYLREEFLKYLKFCLNKEVEVKTYESSLPFLKANLKAIDPNFDHIGVTDLKTPIGVEPCSIIRIGDCISLTIPLPNV